VVEGARLESVYTRKGIAGSNPALSARFFYEVTVSSLKLMIYNSHCKEGTGFFFLIMSVVCFMLFLRDGRYIKIYKEFSKSKMGSGHTATWITVAYVLVSILALFSKVWLH
jgi:hypothetical protein